MIEDPRGKWYVDKNKPPYWFLQGRPVRIFHPSGAVVLARVDYVEEGRMYVLPKGSRTNVPMGIEFGLGFMFDSDITEEEFQEDQKGTERNHRLERRKTRKTVI